MGPWIALIVQFPSRSLDILIWSSLSVLCTNKENLSDSTGATGMTNGILSSRVFRENLSLSNHSLRMQIAFHLIS